MRALSFLPTAVCSQCWKKHAQLMKSKASVGISPEESGKELFSRYNIILLNTINCTPYYQSP